MKKLIVIITLLISLCSCDILGHREIWDKLQEHEDRIQKLEEMCSRLNENISALQAVLTALECNDYVTDVTKVMENGVEIGYSITFAKGGTVTIYHGSDGTDGSAPKIGIRKASDGEYYWTSDGEWLTGEDGKKIPATVPETDGKYITPQFRIAEGIWYISYDGGSTWREFSKSAGGSILFSEVTYDEDFIYLTLQDGTRLAVPRTEGLNVAVSLERISTDFVIFVGTILKKTIDLKVSVYYSTKEDLTLYDYKGKASVTRFEGDNFTLKVDGLDHGVKYYYFTEVIAGGDVHYSPVKSFTTEVDTAQKTIRLASCGAEFFDQHILYHDQYGLKPRDGYFTYMDVAVNPGTTYISTEGGCRMWFLDSDRNPISTTNISKTAQFTTPDDCFYISISFGVLNEEVNPDSQTAAITETYKNEPMSDYEKIAAAHYKQWTKPITTVAATYPDRSSTTAYLPLGHTAQGIIYSSTFRDGTDALWNINPSTYYSAAKNPASVLYTEDNRGRAYNEAAYYGSVCSTTALKCCGYRFPYNTNELHEAWPEKTDHNIDNVESGDILWTSGHVAGVVEVIRNGDGTTRSVKIVEQASYVRVFEITRENWDSYFSSHWTTIHRGEIDPDFKAPVEHPENHSIIFARGNNTYVSDYSTMLFYIPTAEKVFLTKNGQTRQYEKTDFPAREVNGVTVYNLASLFDGVGDYYFHTDEDATDICIKTIDKGEVVISGSSATISGYSNCKPFAYQVINIIPKSSSSAYNYWNAPEGYTSTHVYNSYKDITQDTFEIEKIPASGRYKIVAFYETGYGWARELSNDIL